MLSIIISGSSIKSSKSSSSSSSIFDFGKTYYSRASLFRNFGKSEQDVKKKDNKNVYSVRLKLEEYYILHIYKLFLIQKSVVFF
jgi:hypothetical protein